MRLVAAGVSYRATPLRTRERAAAAAADAETLLRYLVGHAGLAGAVLMSTCNRTEFYVTCPDAVVDEVGPRLARYLDPADREGVSRHLSSRTDGAAVEHIFRVAAGLDSMVVGEAQVLGQLKHAHRTARAAGTVDARLDFVMRRAVSTGKRVRSETAIGRGAGSLGEAALAFAATTLGGLRGRGILLIGAGKMSELTARRVGTIGGVVMVASRSQSAERLAAEVGGRAVRLDELAQFADSVDAVIASTSDPDVVLTADAVAGLQSMRAHRPLCIVDIAVPRDVDPDSAAVRGVTLVDIDELGARLDASMAGRRRAVGDAERIVGDELRSTMRVLGERDAVAPTIAALQQRAERVRQQELTRSFADAALDGESHKRLEAMTRSMMRKLLHSPIAYLRETSDDPAVALTLREAFDLDD